MKYAIVYNHPTHSNKWCIFRYYKKQWIKVISDGQWSNNVISDQQWQFYFDPKLGDKYFTEEEYKAFIIENL